MLGETTTDTSLNNGLTAATRTTYDTLGRPVSLTYPDKILVRNTYDKAGHLATIGGYVASLGYNAADDVTLARYANKTTGQWTYDPQRSWLTAQTVTAALDPTTTTPLFNATYTHDPACLVHEDLIHQQQPGPDLHLQRRQRTHHHNERNHPHKLANTHLRRPRQHHQQQHRRWHVHLPAAQEPAPRPPPAPGRTPSPRPTAQPTKTMLAGNICAITTAGTITRQYTWNSNGQLTKIIDNHAGGPSITPTTPTALASNNTTERALRHTTAPRPYTPPQDGLTTSTPAHPRRRTHPRRHHLDNPRWTKLNPCQNRPNRQGITRTNYTAWGQANTGTTDVGYTGHRTMPGTDILDLNARLTDDPSVGRMISADTLVPDPTNPVAYNRYAYAYNNPESYGDPSGHIPVPHKDDPDARWRAAREFFECHGQTYFFQTNLSLKYKLRKPPAQPRATTTRKQHITNAIGVAGAAIASGDELFGSRFGFDYRPSSRRRHPHCRCGRQCRCPVDWRQNSVSTATTARIAPFSAAHCCLQSPDCPAAALVRAHRGSHPRRGTCCSVVPTISI